MAILAVDPIVDRAIMVTRVAGDEVMTTSAYWQTLTDISALASQDSKAKIGSKAGPLLSASAATIADILPTAKADVLRQGLSEAGAALAAITRINPVDRNSLDFVAGQIAAIADILGYAASMTADEDEVNKATKPPYVDILTALANNALRNADIADRLGKNRAGVSQLLDDMRMMGVVTNHRRGLEVYNDLTPVGRLLSAIQGSA